MGKDLYAAFPEARRCFDATAKLLGAEHLEVIFAGPAEKLTSSRFCQTAIYTMSCAALEAFRARYPEVSPVACAGLSLGEYAALYAAGAFDYATGLKLLARRAELMDAACRKSSGGMASVLKADPAVIEFGPGNVLTGLAKRTIPELRLVNINSAAALDTFQNQC